MNLNTVMLPVYWDRIEPEEGMFDFSLVQGAIDLVRSNRLRLVLLWFGTWKNCMSCYVGARWLNGDETHQGRHIRLPDGGWTFQRLKLYRYH